MMKILMTLAVGYLCLDEGNSVNTDEEIEHIVVDSFYQALDRILSKNSQYKYNVNVDKIQFIKKSLRFISQLGKENISVLKILELFPFKREIEVTEEFLCFGFFIQFYRFIFYDTCSIISTEFSKYKYRTKDILKCDSVDYIFDRLNGRIGLFAAFSTSLIIKKDFKYWNLSDVHFDDKMSKFFDEFALRDNCFIIEDLSKKNEEDRNTKKDIKPKKKVRFEMDNNINEDSDYVDMGNLNPLKKENSYEDINNLSRYLILSSSLVSHEFIKDKNEDLKDRKEIAKKLTKLIKPENQLRFEFDEVFCVKLVFQLFEMLALYTYENIIIDLVSDRFKIMVQYKIKSDISKLPVAGKYGHLYTLMLLNQISQCRLKGFQEFYDKNKIFLDEIVKKSKSKMKSIEKKPTKRSSFRMKKRPTSIQETTQYNTPSLEHCLCEYKEDLSNFYNTNEIIGKTDIRSLNEMLKSLYWIADVRGIYPSDIDFMIINGSKALSTFQKRNIVAQEVVNNYSFISFYNNMDTMLKQIKYYNKSYVNALRDVQVHLEELTKKTTCNEKVNVFQRQLKKISQLRKSFEIIELKLLLALIHNFDVTYEFVAIETCLNLKDLKFEAKIKEEDEEKYIIYNIRLNQLKYALLTQLCLKKVISIMKYLTESNNIY